ncbi:MAG TPA: hypothetical protein DCP28_19865, partial [Cytophagales bacterium]|nr:hypothetical protein [Cytophagales bacterium]
GRVWATEAIQLQEEARDTSGLLGSYRIGGILAHIQGDQLEGMRLWERGYVLSVAYSSVVEQANFLQNLAIAYRGLDMQPEALASNLEALRLREDNQLGRIGPVLNNLGAYYSNKGDFETALQYHERNLAILKETEDTRRLAMSLANVGNCYFKLGQEETALQHVEEAIELVKATRWLREWSHSLYVYSQIRLAQQRPAEALQQAQASLDIAQQLEYTQGIYLAKEILYEAHKAMGHLQEALQYHEEYVTLKDSLASRETEKLALRQRYEEQARLDSLGNVKERQLQDSRLEASIRQRKQQTLFWGIGLFLSVVAGSIIFNRLRLTRMQRNIIRQQKDEVELAYKELDRKNQEILSSINYAKRIQGAILPKENRLHGLLGDYFIYYQPKDIVAGDFFWLQQQGGKTMIAVADCTGHGVPGAMVSVVCHNCLNRAVREFGLTDPAAILNKTREMVLAELTEAKEDLADGMDIALCVIEGSTLQFAGAYNSVCVLREGKEWPGLVAPESDIRFREHQDTQMLEIKGNRFPLGKFPTQKPFETRTVHLHPGDMLYLFTDGFSDQFGGQKNRKYNSARFRELLFSLHTLPPTLQLNGLKKEFMDWKGDFMQIDDVCVLGFKV